MYRFVQPFRRKLAEGRTTDEALAELRAEGASIIECIVAVRSFRRCELVEAKTLVHSSAAWADVKAMNEKFQADLEQAVEFLETEPTAKKLLFICSQNRCRSLTAEQLFAGAPGYQVRSAGTQPDARIVVTEGHLGWADMIFCMEKSHLNRLRRKFPEALEGKKVICLHIPDDYEFMQADLIDELRGRLGPYVTVP